MSYYLDTSIVVCLLTGEQKARDVDAWLGSCRGEEWVITGWVVAEVSSALSIKIRRGELTPAERANVLVRFKVMIAESATVAPVAETAFRTAASFSDREDLGLRAGDALHVAVAAAYGATVVTLDRSMAEASLALGVPTVLI